MEKHKDESFFLNYWMFSVHAPFNAKDELIEKYRPLIDPKDPQRSPTYAAMVESMDDAVGTLLDTLDRLKIADNTIIIFFSDNGGNMYNVIDDTSPTSNAPLKGGKASQFEGGIRVPMIVAWPGEIKPASTSDDLVQSTDFYPTLLNILEIEPERGQIFDGTSILSALKGQEFSRNPIFTYFPHNPPVPEWIPPSISIHHEDWKLIREFHQGEKGAHRYRLFDLSTDIGEQKNLATEKPKLVQLLDAKIEAFLQESKAVVPVPNPKFDPERYHPELEGQNRVGRGKKKPTKKPATADGFDPKLQGWKVRNSKYTIKDGIVTLTGTAADPFLGIGAKQFKKQTSINLRVKSPIGGWGKISWGNGTPSIQTTRFPLKTNEWTELKLEILPEADLGILRVHLPANKAPVQVDHLELRSGKIRVSSEF
jgi:hypothetical protein